MTNVNPRISIVVPVYRSAPLLPRLAAEISAALSHETFELILVHDAGPDNSWEVIEKLGQENASVVGLNLRRNVGQHNAIMAGLNHARGEVIVCMDDDLQHSPSDITKLVAKIDEGADLCYTKFAKRRHALWKRWGSALNDKLAGILIDKPEGLYLSPFKAMTSEVKDEVIKYSGPSVYVDGLLLSITSNIATVDVEHHARSEGEGGYTLRKSISLLLKMSTISSITPLRLATMFGFLLAGVGAVLATLLVVLHLAGVRAPEGWPSLMVTALILGGVQLLAVGIVGEYVGRIFLEVRKRPQFVVAETVRDGQASVGKKRVVVRPGKFGGGNGMASGEQEGLDAGSSAGGIRKWPQSALAYVALVGLAITFFAIYHDRAVSHFYATHIAHYDSVGTLTWAVRTLNEYSENGYGAAISAAWELPPLSITQNMFVALASPLLKPVPASIQLYNVLAVAIALSSIAFMAHRFRLSVWAGSLVVGAFFLPDILYFWDLGLFDFRRETGLYSLLVAALAFGAAINLAPSDRNRIRDGVILGVLCGLFLLSRDNAALVGIGVLFVPIAAMWIAGLLRKNGKGVLLQFAGVAAGFLPFFAIFLVRVGDILNRLLDPSIMFANNGDRMGSFTGNLMSPVKVLLGGDQYVFNRFPRSTIILFGVVALLSLAAGGVMLFMRLRNREAAAAPSSNAVTKIGWLPLLALFIWPIIYMHLMLSLVTGWLPGQSLIVGLAPYVPSCVGIVFLAVLVSGVIENAPAKAGKIAAVVSAFLIAASVPVRAETRMIRYPAETFAAHNYLAGLKNKAGGAPLFAELAMSDLRVPSIVLLAAMDKRPEPQSLRFQVNGEGSYDVHIATPPADRIPAFLTALEQAALCKADYILLNDSPAAYAEPGSPQLVPGHGVPLYEALQEKLASASRHVISPAGSQKIVVIDNTARSACQTSG